MKYIDAEKLKAVLEARIEAGLDGYGGNLKWLFESIDSLQQDKAAVELEFCSQSWWEERGWIMIPPETTIEGIDSLLKTVRRKIEQKCPPVLAEFMEKASEIGKKYNYGFGPNLSSLQQEQSEVDIEKEIEEYLINNSGFLVEQDSKAVVHALARHFYELGRQKQFAIDADLGSPKYERGFCDGRDFEKDKIQNLIPTLRLCKEWFDEIVEKASRLTTGNVAHLGATIRGFARNYSEYVEEELGKNSK